VVNRLNLHDPLHSHADLKYTGIHLNARDEFLLSRAFSLGHHRNFLISALLIRSPNLPSAGCRRDAFCLSSSGGLLVLVAVQLFRAGIIIWQPPSGSRKGIGLRSNSQLWEATVKILPNSP